MEFKTCNRTFWKEILSAAFRADDSFIAFTCPNPLYDSVGFKTPISCVTLELITYVFDISGNVSEPSDTLEIKVKTTRPARSKIM